MNSIKQKKYDILSSPVFIISIIILEYYLFNRTLNIINSLILLFINYCFFKNKFTKGILILLNLIISKLIAYYLHFIFPDIWIIILPIIFFKIIFMFS